MAAFPDPRYDVGDRSEVLLGYLDYFRATLTEKVTGLGDAALRRSRLPSGWTPLGLIQHLVAMERRWLVWGFLAEQVAEPWPDASAGLDGPWQVAADETLSTLLASLHDGGRRTRSVVEGAHLSDSARTGGRFTADDPAPSLERILLHVLQEYARHAGHLDVVRELLDGNVGE